MLSDASELNFIKDNNLDMNWFNDRKASLETLKGSTRLAELEWIASLSQMASLEKAIHITQDRGFTRKYMEVIYGLHLW